MKKGIDEGTLSGRYASIRFAAGLTKKAFAEALGIHPVVSGDIELGKREPSRDVLVRLASAYGVDINWLLTGTRAADSEFPYPPAGSSSAGAFGAGGAFSGAGPGASGQAGYAFGAGSAAFAADDDDRIARVPFILQEAAAGAGIEIEDWPEMTTVPVLRSFIAPRRADRVRAVEVRGDSMTGIGLDDGDIVLFSIDEKTGDGVHVISIGSSLLVKRVHFEPAAQAVRIISENPQYPVRTLEGPDLEGFRVEGRVVGWLHRY